ncbi:hypothetical protein [Actinomadura violacea]|uniref:WXG100 family type VII secretion target n=1 Tax=Actinomadura violacea TaxID=2819934 RepID=A0ABS3RKZ8_9ACTN|nr:hypothetical protein [Actinomadura violacea]MBO2457296.1 hypothetical protein [Actinomadura violacea]
MTETRQFNPAHLRETGKSADDLGDHVQKALKKLEDAHQGVKAGADGFAFAGALGKVFDSWDHRLGALRGECWSIAATFRANAGKDQATEQGLVTGMNKNFNDLINFRTGD